MSLVKAVHMMGASGTIAMQSDRALAAAVEKHQAKLASADPSLATKMNVQVARGAHGPLRVRPIAAMLELARGTVLSTDPILSSFARRWSTLRYLGLFGRRPATGGLHLNADVTAFIGANQRRVMSEELGIGFGILVAKHWCRARTGTRGPIEVIDVDSALNNRAVTGLRKRGDRQPDYLLTYSDPATPGARIFELLETKGTATSSNARTQLGRAVTQLAGLTVDGKPLTGIAVSTVSNATDLRALAVDPEELPFSWSPHREDLHFWRHTPPTQRHDNTRINVSSREFFSHAINVSAASLALFGAQDEAARRWMPNLGARPQAPEASRAIRSTSLGTFLGSESVIQFSGTKIRLFEGVEAEIATSLQAVDPGAVLEAQESFRQRDSASMESPEVHNIAPPAASAVAASPDGSMLEIRVE